MAGLNINNSLTGSGNVDLAGSGDLTYDFRSTNNTFSGNISVSAGGNYSGELRMNSLEDTVGRSIKLGLSGAGGKFTYGTGAVVPLVLNERQIVLQGTYGGGTFKNNATNANTAVTISKDLLITGVGNKTFTLGGSNTNDNNFAGAITNGSGSVISLTKADAGKWILSGTNTYTGTTTIADGTLEFASSGTYAGNITVTDTTPSPLTFSGSYTQTVSGVISGSMQLIKEGTGTLVLTGANTHTGTVVNAGTLSLGNGTSSSSLYDFSTLSVASGAKVNLNYTGSDAVFYLNLGGSPAAAGTWGATDSGAANTNDTYFTGTGVIDNLSGDTTGISTAFWDGGASDIGTDGNAASLGGAGTWNTTLKNWDYGFVPHKAWADTTAMKAVFAGAENADRTVTVTGPLNIKELSFETTGSSGTRYKIDGGTLNFGAGGMIRTAHNEYNQTITSTITGSPAVEIKDAGNAYEGLKFEPASGKTQNLGVITNPIDTLTGTSDKAGVYLGGTSTGNTITSIGYAPTGNSVYGTVNKTGTGIWTVGEISTGTLRISGGKLICNGPITLMYNGLVMSGSGILSGSNTVYKSDRRSANDFVSGTGVAPGDGIGTITFDWGTGGTPTAAQWVTAFRSGSIYEWEVGAESSDKVHVVDGRLIVEGFTLKIINAGGSPKATDMIPVFTYGTLDSKTLSLGSVTIDKSAVPTWTGSPTLVDNGTGTIYLTGLEAPAAGTLISIR